MDVRTTAALMAVQYLMQWASRQPGFAEVERSIQEAAKALQEQEGLSDLAFALRGTISKTDPKERARIHQQNRR